MCVRVCVVCACGCEQFDDAALNYYTLDCHPSPGRWHSLSGHAYVEQFASTGIPSLPIALPHAIAISAVFSVSASMTGLVMPWVMSSPLKPHRLHRTGKGVCPEVAIHCVKDTREEKKSQFNQESESAVHRDHYSNGLL